MHYLVTIFPKNEDFPPRTSKNNLITTDWSEAWKQYSSAVRELTGFCPDMPATPGPLHEETREFYVQIWECNLPEL